MRKVRIIFLKFCKNLGETYSKFRSSIRQISEQFGKTGKVLRKSSKCSTNFENISGKIFFKCESNVGKILKNLQKLVILRENLEEVKTKFVRNLKKKVKKS